VEKDVESNTVVVVEGNNDSALYKQKINLTNVNFLNQSVPSLIRAPVRRSPPEADEGGNKRIDVLARIRYRQPLARAILISHQLIFDEPQKFVAPGQSAVFYLPSEALLCASEAVGEGVAKEGCEYEMLGGGIIV